MVLPDLKNLNDPETWDRLMESIQPASILVALRQRMDAGLLRTHSAEDIWQETIYQSWRDRDTVTWQSMVEFRRWVVAIALNRLKDVKAREGAQKRGGEETTVPFSSLEGATQGDECDLERLLPVRSTTPSRIAIYREQAGCMERALTSLPEDLRDVVRLRLFEEMSLQEVADQLHLGVSAVRHRLRKGAAVYARVLQSELSLSGIRGV